MKKPPPLYQWRSGAIDMEEGVGGGGPAMRMQKGAINRSAPAREFARELRKSMSLSEKVLWERLRKDRLGFRFKRQVPIGNYVLDFYCSEAALCVEVDGEQHEQSVERDNARDEYLKVLRIETIRIPLISLFNPGIDFDRLSEKIQRLCEDRSGRKAF